MSVTDDNEINNSVESDEEVETNEDKPYVVNELLFYVSNHTKGGSCTPDNIKRIVLSFYDLKPILAAKTLLWKKVKSGILRKLEKRNDTRQRSAKEANVADIVQAFQDIDKKSYDDIAFLASDINNIPREHPENLHDLSMLDRIAVLERKCKVVETSTSRNYAGMLEFVDEISKSNGIIATHEKLINDLAQQLQDEVQNKKCTHKNNSESKSDQSVVIEEIPSPINKIRSSSLPELGNSNGKCTQEKLNVQNVSKAKQTGGKSVIQGKNSYLKGGYKWP